MAKAQAKAKTKSGNKNNKVPQKSTSSKRPPKKKNLNGVVGNSGTKNPIPKLEHWSETRKESVDSEKPLLATKKNEPIVIEDTDLDLNLQSDKKSQKGVSPAIIKQDMTEVRKKNKIVKLIPLAVPFIAFVVLVINLLVLDVLPIKYFIILLGVLGLAILLLGVLFTRRHRFLRVLAYILGLLFTAASVYASYYLIVTNAAINDFANSSTSVTDQTNSVDITTTPFVVIINGLDKMAEGDVDKSANSDVNQLVVVNPVEHKILLVNTPRDYYVQLHGVPEMKDKLTHAGYYGVDMSRQTLEDLYNIDINYYVRINFNTLVDLVDLIGGIDVYSEYEFTAKTKTKSHFVKGWNHLNGQQALDFSRERKYFSTGDIQRAADQQTVIIAIFNKITHSPALLGNFSSILNSLSASLRTDLPINDLKKLVRIQIDEMPSWDIETTAVSGEAIYTKDVYSLKDTGQKYYVVIPDEKSVAEAREKILTVLDRSSD